MHIINFLNISPYTGVEIMKRWNNEAAMRIFLITAAFCALSPTLQAKEAKPAESQDLRSTSWTELAQEYANPYATESTDGIMTPEVLSEWWKVFHDDTLNELIEIALTNSKDITAARSRLNQAREQVGIAKAARLPWINVNGGWMRGEVPDNVVDGLTPDGLKSYPLGIENTDEGSYAGIDASWEIDVFGKTRAKIRAASDTLQARNAQLYGTWVSLSAEVAMNYITLRTLQEELAVTEAHIKNQKENLDLLQVNHDAGLVSALPTDQATYTLRSSEARVPELKKAIADTLNRISVLTGTVPGALNDKLLTRQPLPDIDARLYNAIPAEVLRQRPDVHAAERAWAAQIARTSAAKAELKPKFSILGLLGFATLTGGLFSSGSQGFAILPQVSFPLFHGGALRKNVRVQKEKEKEMQANYEKTVLQAAGEVRSSMTAITQDHVRRETLEQGRDAARDAYGLAQNRFANGISDYMDVLDAERSYLELDQNYTVSKGKELTSMVSLFKALGGGWKPLDAQEAQEAAAAAKKGSQK
jgi:NodT family efflux transporter outer membrane factor (OMF) lipoprotein